MKMDKHTKNLYSGMIFGSFLLFPIFFMPDIFSYAWSVIVAGLIAVANGGSEK